VSPKATTDPDGATIDTAPVARAEPRRAGAQATTTWAAAACSWRQRRSQACGSVKVKVATIDPSIVQRRILTKRDVPEVGAAGELFFSRRRIELDPYPWPRGDARRATSRRDQRCSLGNVHADADTVPTFILEGTRG
jgi:hypothetical protein